MLHWVATGEIKYPLVLPWFMGRSKNLHMLQLEVDVTQPDGDADENWASGVIQVDQLLSKELGRTIRNGNSFRLVGFGSTLRGLAGSSDLDVGFAGTNVVSYCPVTKNGVGAWQSLHKQWMKQKQLSGGIGKYVRYDDFEIGWRSPSELLASGRQSTILMSGLGDTIPEDIVLYGPSSDGVNVSLEDYYDSLNPIPLPSEDPFGAVIKTAKFLNKFPDYRSLMMPATFSAQTTDGGYYSGAIATGEIQWLPADNHISHMTGTLRYYFKGIAPDTDIPPAIPDELKLIITLVYEGWAPLNEVRSAKPVTKQISKPKKTTNARRRS